METIELNNDALTMTCHPWWSRQNVVPLFVFLSIKMINGFLALNHSNAVYLYMCIPLWGLGKHFFLPFITDIRATFCFKKMRLLECARVSLF